MNPRGGNDRQSEPARAALAAAIASEKAGQEYGATAKVIKKIVSEVRSRSVAENDRGDKVAARLSKTVDAIIAALFVGVADRETRISIVAVGGYGRSELAPYSDIDLLILQADRDDEACKPFLERFLYPIWDAGLKAGHAVHSPSSAVAFSREDMVARTAFLDARFLCGDKELFEDFQARYEKLRKRTKTGFVKAKLEEQDLRQAKAGETRNVTEPDIKEGKGGLRDLQTIRWIYKYVYRGDADMKASIAKVMGPTAQKDLAKAERFLWSVRAHLHDVRGRADERLTFDVQPAIARRLGYADRSDMSAAERLMKHYFVTAVEVGRLTRVLCAKLEEERTKRLPHMPKLMPRALLTDEAPGKPNLRLRNGRLAFDSPARARRQPRDLFRLFRAFSKKPGIDFHPDALEVVSASLPLVTSEVRSDPVIAELFLAMLVKSVDPERTLRIMSESGLLGKYLPSFGAIIGRIEYGLYRPVTIDEHVLLSIGHVRRISKGELLEEHPISTKILKNAKNKKAFFFAILMHQSVWSLKDRTPAACERLVMRVAKRFGFEKEERQLIAWTCAQHELMVRTVERRNIADARAIANFAEEVQSIDRLNMLVVLSTCYQRIVGRDSWDEYTRRRLITLHEATRTWISGGEEAYFKSRREQFEAASKEISERLQDWTEQERRRFTGRLTDLFVQSVGKNLMLRIANLVRAAEKDDVAAAVSMTSREDGLEAIVFADDRIGLLGDLAGAISAEGGSVRSVRASAFGEDKAIDVFLIQPDAGENADDPSKIRRFHESLLKAARARAKAKPDHKRRFGDRRGIFDVPAKVRIDEAASDASVVVEADGLDRPGLLHDLASALADLGVTIASAHVATYGERAVDAFYLTEADGRKVRDKKRLKAIEGALADVLSSGEDE